MKHVIIGDGVAGATAAEEIRKKDEDAEIHVLTDETDPLYNRIMLKTYMKGSLPKQYTRLHDENWYDKRDIQLHLETEIKQVLPENNQVETSDGDRFGYDRLLVATGGSPKKLPQDEDFDNLHYMWTMGDAEHIKKAAEESEKAVVVGGGLLGIDLAMAYAENDTETYYLIRGDNWWQRGLDKDGAEIIHKKMEEKGVNVLTNSEVEEIESEDSNVKVVVDSKGERYECDSMAVAIGQNPNSDILEAEKNEYEMLKTNEQLETSINNVYAAGNMVEYYSPVFEKRTFNGSWDHSEAMGETAGENMAGKEEDFDFVNTYGVGHFQAQFLAIGDWSGEPVSKNYEEENHYRRLFFRDDKLVGAVMIGYTRGQEELKKIIREKEAVKNREKLLEKSYWS
ncbi:MAG: NAD(P)/FAD-dependent oxidoreductase [Nanohaloarchaea archaeon]|nr:NAD(P)/FAD-dependent oxidoreductase [Candidatus Nanohaloarchaea archaeon]